MVNFRLSIENSHKILTLSFSSILISFSTVFIIFPIHLESISPALLQVQQCCNFIIPEFQVLICVSSLHSETKWVTFSSIFLHMLHFKESVVFYLCSVLSILFKMIHPVRPLVFFFRFPFFVHSHTLSYFFSTSHKCIVHSFLRIVFFALLP